jgi:hypothetical protein
MDQYLIKKPSAWVPMLLSLGMLVFIASVWATLGLAREPDEGTPAHVFQLWLVLEAILIAFFAIKWLPRSPKPALLILAVQLIAVLGACAPVRYFQL